MQNKLPRIIQGGMGFGVSGWRLASAVSRVGQLGVVSGTALDLRLVRMLQDGDPGGHVRRALECFPFPWIVQRVLKAFFLSEGLPAGKSYKQVPMHTLGGSAVLQELCVLGNFVEVFLAKEGHDQPVGINYLEKIQLPYLPSVYGAMLAGVSVVLMGAGIPLSVPGTLDALSKHQPAQYPIAVNGQGGRMRVDHVSFDPAELMEGASCPDDLTRPDFLPIVSTESLASILLKRSNGSIAGFVVEGHLAGGHNAPPRSKNGLSDEGEPLYGPRDDANLDKIRNLGLPFWLGGSCGSPEGVERAIAVGAEGVQVGTAFALCEESGLRPEIRRVLVRMALTERGRVFTDPVASPTGFPFKVAALEGSLSEAAVYERRRRVCDIGILRQPYLTADGRLGYRCAAEPVRAYIAKGGLEDETVGRKCLCNALFANIQQPPSLIDGSQEQPLITIGDDFVNVGRFCNGGNLDFTAADVVQALLV